MMEQCVILVGGRGTRLGSLTDSVPKPMVDVGGRPFLDWLIARVAAQGVGEILLLAGYLGEQVAARYDGTRHGATRIRCEIEAAPLGTGGALKNSRLLAPEFLMMNGDTLFEVDLADLAGLAAAGDWLGKLALRRLPDTSRSGVVELAADGRITAFRERGGPAPGLVNGGIYALKRGVLDWIGALPCSLEGQVFPGLAAAGLLRGAAYDGWFIDIGVPADLARAQTEIPARAGGAG